MNFSVVYATFLSSYGLLVQHVSDIGKKGSQIIRAYTSYCIDLLHIKIFVGVDDPIAEAQA